MSKVREYDPLFTPDGKPVKVGRMVATPAVPAPGVAVQQWMWELVLFTARHVRTPHGRWAAIASHAMPSALIASG